MDSLQATCTDDNKSYITFTNFDTVLCDFMSEVDINTFFKNLDDMIDKNKVSNCVEDYANNRISFDYNNKTYYFKLDDEQIANLKNGNINSNLFKIHDLFRKEKQKEYREIYKKELEIRKERQKRLEESNDDELLEEAKKGNFRSERSKELFKDYLLKELISKKKLIFKDLFKDSFNKFSIYKFAYKFSSEKYRNFRKDNLSVLFLIGLLCQVTISFWVGCYDLGRLIYATIVVLPQAMFFYDYIFAFISFIPVNVYSVIKTLIKRLKSYSYDKSIIKKKIKSIGMINYNKNNIVSKNLSIEAKIDVLCQQLSVEINELSNDKKNKYLNAISSIKLIYQRKLDNSSKVILENYGSYNKINNDLYNELISLEKEVRNEIKNEKSVNSINSSLANLIENKNDINKYDERVNELTNSIELAFKDMDIYVRKLNIEPIDPAILKEYVTKPYDSIKKAYKLRLKTYQYMVKKANTIKVKEKVESDFINYLEDTFDSINKLYNDTKLHEGTLMLLRVTA